MIPIALAFDGSGNLFVANSGSGSGTTVSKFTLPKLIDSKSQAVFEDSNGTLYNWDTDGSFYVLPTGSSTWVEKNLIVNSTVVPVELVTLDALDASGSTVDVMGGDGNYWQFNGTTSTWTLLAGPHFSFSVPVSATAGQATSLTVTVLDAFGNQVAAYLDTVHFTSSDVRRRVACGLSVQILRRRDAHLLQFDDLLHGRKPDDHGHRHAGPGDNGPGHRDGGPGRRPRSSASPAPRPSRTPTMRITSTTWDSRRAPPREMTAPFTVTACDPYGNVATGYTGTIQLVSTDPQVAAAMPAPHPFTAADQGVYTFSSVPFDTSGGQTVTATPVTTNSAMLAAATANSAMLTAAGLHGAGNRRG